MDPEKKLIVLGPPGTGKTTHLVRERIPRAVSRYGAMRVIVGSYTKAAATEIAGRLGGIELPKENVGTVHALALRALGGTGGATLWETDKDICGLWNEAFPHYAMSGGKVIDADNPLETTTATGSSIGDGFLADYNLARAQCAPIPPHIADFVEKYEAFKAEQAAMDYTDMLTKCLEEEAHPVNDPKVAIFDEAQDLSALQYKLIGMWAERMDFVLLCGDDDQCIYDWAGASPAPLLDDIAEERVKVLDQSYRIPSEVHRVALSMVSNISERREKLYKPRDERGSVTYEPITLETPEYLGGILSSALAERQTVMVLASCNYMLNATIGYFKREGFPFGNRYRLAHGGWNPLAKRKGITKAERMAAFLHDGEVWTPTALEVFTKDLGQEALQRGARKRILALDVEAEVNVALLRDLFREDWLAAVIQSTQRDGLPSLDVFEQGLTSKARDAYGYHFRVLRRFGMGALLAPPPITVGTIHSVKGGEADNVVLFPDLSGKALDQVATDGWDYMRRLFYVGMTRAKHALILCDAGQRSAGSINW